MVMFTDEVEVVEETRPKTELVILNLTPDTETINYT